MYKGKMNADTSVNANTNIPFKTILNTNGNTTANTTNNYVTINTTGYYNIFANLVITDATATPIEAMLMANGTVIASATSDITASTGTITVPIMDAERIAIAPQTDIVQIAVQVDSNATIGENSTLLIEKVR